MFKRNLITFKRNLITISRVNRSTVLDESYYNHYESNILEDAPVSINNDLHYISLTRNIVKEGYIYKINKQIIKKITPFNKSELMLYVRCHNSTLIKNDLVNLFDNEFYKYGNEHYIGDKNNMMDNIINLIKNEN